MKGLQVDCALGIRTKEPQGNANCLSQNQDNRRAWYLPYVFLRFDGRLAEIGNRSHRLLADIHDSAV